jgi:hypothetical protein
MAHTVTINRPDAVALIEEAARQLTGGNKTEVVVLAMRGLLDRSTRTGTLFGAHPGSVRVRDGVDLTQPVLDVDSDAASGAELSAVTAWELAMLVDKGHLRVIA